LPIGLTLSASDSPAIGSTSRNVPSGASDERMWAPAATGSPMSCRASKTVTRSYPVPGKSFAPAIYTSGGRQNVTTGGMPNSAPLVKVGGASAVYKPSLAYHKNAFTFVTGR